MLLRHGSDVPGLVKVLKACASPWTRNFGFWKLMTVPAPSPLALPISASTQYSAPGASVIGWAVMPGGSPITPGGKLSAICDVAQKLAGTGVVGGLGRAPSPGRRPSSPARLLTNSTDVYSWGFVGQCGTAAVLRKGKLKGASLGESSILPAVIQ